MTDTEEVSIEEEYEMQKSWITDNDSINIIKFSIELTFLISINGIIIGDINIFFENGIILQ